MKTENHQIIREFLPYSIKRLLIFPPIQVYPLMKWI